MKILLVEDGRETVEYILTALASQGPDIDQTRNDGESLLLAGASSYEVTIVDRMLWHWTGSRWSNVCASSAIRRQVMQPERFVKYAVSITTLGCQSN